MKAVFFNFSESGWYSNIKLIKDFCDCLVINAINVHSPSKLNFQFQLQKFQVLLNHGCFKRFILFPE